MLNDILPVTITEKALKMIVLTIEEKKIPGFYGLRIGVKGGGGCGGFAYLLGFDHKNEGDAEFEVSGIKVFIEKKQMMYVAGKVVDYVENEEEKGFVFS